MLAFKYLLLTGAIGMIIAAVAIITYDVYLTARYRRALVAGVPHAEPEPVRWRMTIALALIAWGPMLIAFSIIVVPSGQAGVRVSQLSGTRPGTMYPGVHLVTPLVDNVEIFDTRDRLFTTGVTEAPKKGEKADSTVSALRVQAREGLTLGLAITVRYKLDANRLDYIQSRLPQPVETELVPAVVASAWRELVPNYTVREVFSSK